jgi:hypothetical protein
MEKLKWKNIQMLWNLRKPRFKNLDFVDLIIDEKPLFLLAWELSNGNGIRIINPSGLYRNPEGSIVITIPKDLDTITVTAFNYWRKNSVTVRLKHTQLDTETAASLIQNLRVFNTVKIKQSPLHVNIAQPGLRQTIIHLNTSGISIRNINAIKTLKLNYYEQP